MIYLGQTLFRSNSAFVANTELALEATSDSFRITSAPLSRSHGSEGEEEDMVSEVGTVDDWTQASYPNPLPELPA